MLLDLEKKSPAILWNVVERHLDEAEFLFDQWENALQLPRYSLKKSASTIERRLLAHLDGLQVGGVVVAERLLRPALFDPKELSRVSVSALALLSMGDEGIQSVFNALHTGEEALHPALCRALVVSMETRIDEWLLARLDRSIDENQKAQALEILAGRGVHPESLLLPCLNASEPRLIAASLEAIRRFSRRELLSFVDRFLYSEFPNVRMSAIKAGLTLGSRRAWESCLEWADVPRLMSRERLVLVSLLGQGDDLAALFNEPRSRANAENMIWALGFAGTVEAGEACLPFLNGKDPRASKLAADSLGWIAGFDSRADEFSSPDTEPSKEDTLPPFAEDDLDADLTPDGVDHLPFPNCEGVNKRWASHRRRASNATRYVMGESFSGDALAHALQNATLWRRHAIALEISIRTHAAVSISTHLFSARQRVELSAYLPLPSFALQTRSSRKSNA